MRARRRNKLWVGIAVLLATANAVAYRHAWRLTHFVPAEMVSKSPAELSLVGKLGVLVRGMEVAKPATIEVGPEYPQPLRTVKLQTRDGLQLEAWDIPTEGQMQGVAALFHGYAASRGAMLDEARALHELGWRTLLVDFRGSGGADGWVTTLGWKEAEGVRAAAEWVRREWPSARLVLYGESMGAAAVLRSIAVYGVHPDGIVVEGPYDRLLTMIGRYYQSLNLPAFPFANMLVFWGGVQHGFNAFQLNPVEYARATTCPALVLDGDLDPWVKPAEVRSVAAAMKGPTEYRIFANGGHGGYVRDVPEEYQATLRQWLATLPTTPVAN